MVTGYQVRPRCWRSGNAGFGVFELELLQVFLLLQLHQGLHLAKLFFEGVGVEGGESGGGIGQEKAGWVGC